MKRLTNEEVICRFIKIHGTELYDYSKVQYRSKEKKLQLFVKNII